MPIYSFDIFDTLITRETATPIGIFLIVQHKLRESYSQCFPIQLIEEYFLLRVEEENKARDQSEYEECTFESIFSRIQRRYQLSLEQTDLLKRIEIECEHECVAGIPYNIKRIHELLDSGCRVVLVSDTYLSKDIIRSLLSVVDTRIADCPLYVSSEKHVAKHTGNLFRLILKEEKITGTELFHVGDNRGSDYDVPRRLGINVEHFNWSAVSDYEKDYFSEDRLYIQLLAGASKNFRLLHPDSEAIERIGACLGGPLLYGYVDSILQQSFGEGVKRIYFLSRDGQILLKIANVINSVKKYGLDFRYLYISRQVCYLASLFEITQREIYWLRDFMHTFSELATRVGEDPQVLYSFLPDSFKMRMGGVDKLLSARLVEGLCDFLMADNDISRKIRHRCEELRELLCDYLVQEGLFEQERVCIVDIGWTGRMQDSLYKLIACREPSKKIKYHYFGMPGRGWERYTPYTSAYNDKKAYIDLPMEDRIHLPFMEVLTSADHETTLSYTRTPTGDVVPVMDSSASSVHWNLAGYQQALIWFAERFCAISSKFSSLFNYHRDIAPLLLRQAANPSPEVASCLGNIPYTLGHSSKTQQSLAPSLNLSAVIAWGLNRNKELASWMGGALQRSSWHVRCMYHLLFSIRILLRGLKQKVHLLQRYIHRKLRNLYYNLLPNYRH